MRRFWMAAAVAAIMAAPGTALAGEKGDAKADPKAKPAPAHGAKPGDKAKPTAAKPTTVKFAVVMVNDQEIFRLADTDGRTASERADELGKRIRGVVEPDPGEQWRSVQASDVVVESVDTLPIIRLRNQNVITVTAQDAQLNRRKAQELAQRWAEELRVALKEIKLEKGNKLPADFVAVASGQLEFGKPQGGGAGGTPPGKEQLGPMEPVGPVAPDKK